MFWLFEHAARCHENSFYEPNEKLVPIILPGIKMYERFIFEFYNLIFFGVCFDLIWVEQPLPMH